MPALIQSSGENRRPRRSSITHQFQRMFHKEKTGDTRKSIYQDPFGETPTPSIRKADSGSFDYANYGPSEISSVDYSHRSPSSLNSKFTGLNTESRHSSIQSFQLDQHQAPESLVADGPLPKQEHDRSPFANHGVVEKKDRRATKRLEAERLELEKRMLKLEEAERTNNESLLRRGSRRLTKKQPLESVSRSSSVSGDESRSRPPSRLSSIFSSARRRSRSRQSSVDGNEDAQSSHEDAPSSNHNALPTLSTTLPDRLGTAISKELAARKNAVLTSPVESSLSLKLPQKAGPDYCYSSQITIRGGQEATHYAAGAIAEDNVINIPDQANGRMTHDMDITSTGAQHQADLDRTLFTANLKSKRRSAIPPSGQASRSSQPASKKAESDAGHSEAQSLTDDDQVEKKPRYRSKSPRKGLPRSILARASTDGVIQRQEKKFKSSPLAESQTIEDEKVPGPKRASTLATLQADTARSQVLAADATQSELNVTSSPATLHASHENVPGKDYEANLTVPASVTRARNARTSTSRVPALSQLTPSAPSTKPRFYHSLNKGTDPSGGRPQVIRPLSLASQERDSSPPVPPRSPKRNSRALSQTSDLEPDTERPTSSLSVRLAQESDSDYDTADENASTNGDLPLSTETVPAKDTRSPKKRDSGLESAHTWVPSSSKTDSEKRVKKTNQHGRDQLVAKLFVICCRCKHWHDMPSDVYASLAVSDPLSAALDHELAAWERNTLDDVLMTGALSSREPSAKVPKPETHQRLRTRIMAGLPSEPVNCCWCQHQMSSSCCQGWMTVVQMRQRHH